MGNSRVDHKDIKKLIDYVGRIPVFKDSKSYIKLYYDHKNRLKVVMNPEWDGRYIRGELHEGACKHIKRVNGKQVIQNDMSVRVWSRVKGGVLIFVFNDRDQ